MDFITLVLTVFAFLLVDVNGYPGHDMKDAMEPGGSRSESFFILCYLGLTTKSYSNPIFPKFFGIFKSGYCNARSYEFLCFRGGT